jgi:hypothetical protein
MLSAERARPMRGTQRSPAYVAFARILHRLCRHDLLLPVASAIHTIEMLAALIQVAEEEADLAAVRRYKIESMKHRVLYEHALRRVVSATTEGELGSDILGKLLGGPIGERPLKSLEIKYRPASGARARRSLKPREARPKPDPRPRPERPPKLLRVVRPKPCRECGELFSSKYHNVAVCSSKCRAADKLKRDRVKSRRYFHRNPGNCRHRRFEYRVAVLRLRELFREQGLEMPLSMKKDGATARRELARFDALVRDEKLIRKEATTQITQLLQTGPANPGISFANMRGEHP